MVSIRYIPDGCCSANVLQHSLEERWKPQLGRSQWLSLTYLLLPLTLHKSKASVNVWLAKNVQKISSAPLFRFRGLGQMPCRVSFQVLAWWVTVAISVCMNGCCTPTPFWNSLENPSCFPLQDICFVWTECSESGHCYSYILLLLHTTCYYTMYYFSHSCPIHGTTSASSFYVGGFTLQVSVALFVHSYFVPA